MLTAYDHATRPYHHPVIDAPSAVGAASNSPTPALIGSLSGTRAADAPNAQLRMNASAYGDATLQWCLQTNPSCTRDPWWVEHNDDQATRLVEYRFIGPGLVTEERFVEAIWFLWQWPEGKAILGAAADVGVTIAAGPEDDAFAIYSPLLGRIRVNRAFSAATWMVADVLAHELKHVADFTTSTYVSDSFADCLTREQRAYAVEQRFLRWTTDRFGGLPPHAQVTDRLAPEHLDLYENLYTLRFSSDVNSLAENDYFIHCRS
jgi:hypothetical protein